MPPSVQVGADVAQIIMSGGAVASDISMGASMGSFVSPAALAISATTDLLENVGLMSSDSPAAQMLQYGLDLLLVISSGGMNVLADLSLVLDTIKQFMQFSMPDLTPKIEAQAHATNKQAFYQWFTTKEKQEASAAALSFKDYQEGRLSVFQMMGKVAESSPELFDNYFPDMKAFLPPITINVTETTRIQQHQTGGVFGLSSRDYDITESDTFSYQTIKDVYSPQEVAQAIARKFLDPILQVYTMVNRMTGNVYSYYPDMATHRLPKDIKLTIYHWALLSLFQPNFQYVDQIDIRTILLNLQITPFDLGYETVDFCREAIPFFNQTFNGVDQTVMTKIKSHPHEAYIQYFDETGNINQLLKDKDVSAQIKSWGTMPDLKTSSTFDPRWIPNIKKPEMLDRKTGYGDVRNLWSAMSMIDLMNRDPYFESLTVGGLSPAEATLATYGLQDFAHGNLGGKSNFEQLHQKIQMISAGRKMNMLAKSNVASFFNTTPDKIAFLPGEPGKLTKVNVN